MKRIWGQLLTGAVTAAAICIAVPACEDNDRSIFIEGVLAPSQTRVSGACEYTGDVTQAYLSIGRLDVGVTQAYLAEMLIGNQLISQSNQSQPQADSSRVHINGAVVHLADPNGGTIADFTSLGTGFVDAALNNIPSYGPVTIPLTDADSTATLRKMLRSRSVSTTIVATVKVFGITIGNTDVESGEFNFPLEVCNGCLISYGGDASTDGGVTCNGVIDQTLLQATTNPCSVGQDIATDCRLCRGTQTPDLCANSTTNP